MDFRIYVVIVLVIVLAVLFWPKKKKSAPEDLDDVTSDDTKKAVKGKKIKEKPAKSNRSAKSLNSVQKEKKKNTRAELKAKKSSKGKHVQKAEEPELSDEDLFSEEFSMPEADASSMSMQQVTDEETAEHAQEAPESTYYAEHAPADESTYYGEHAPADELAEAPAESSIESSTEAAEESKPVIKMDSEPVVRSNRVRKKLHPESKVVEEKQDDVGISFLGTEMQSMPPTFNGIFDDPELFAQSQSNAAAMADLLRGNYEKEEANDSAKVATEKVVATIDVPQVSSALEPMKKEPSDLTEAQTTAQEEAEKSTNDGIVPTEEEVNKNDSVATESTAEQPTDSVEAAHEENDNTVPSEDAGDEPESEPVEEAIEPEEPVEKPAEEPAEEPASPRFNISRGEPIKGIKHEVDTFIPGSVSMHKPTGLKFRERTHTKKVSECLPVEVVPKCEDDRVQVIIESANVKPPVRGENGTLALFNSHVYKHGTTVPWDIRFEVPLVTDEEVTVDTGVGIRVPRGYGIKLIPVDNMQIKFGLELVSPENLSQREAAYSIKFTVKASQIVSYVAKNQPLVMAKIFRI